MRAAACLVALSLALPAPAAATRRWALGDIAVEGVADDAERGALVAELERALDRHPGSDAAIAAAVARVLGQHPELRGCSDDACNLRLGDLAGVERLIRLRVSREAPGRWTAHVLDFAVDSAEVAAAFEVPCAGCDAGALVRAIDRALAPRLADGAGRPLCRLEVEATPPAAVALDGVRLGRTPFAHSVAAGRHVVAVDADEGQRGAGEVECREGGREHLGFTRAAGAWVARRRSRATAPPPWRALGVASAVAAGVSAVGLGVAIAFHHRPACAGDCAFRYDASAGIALGAVGTALFGVASAVLLVRARRPLAHAAVTPALWPRGAGLVVEGGF